MLRSSSQKRAVRSDTSEVVILKSFLRRGDAARTRRHSNSMPRCAFRPSGVVTQARSCKAVRGARAGYVALQVGHPLPFVILMKSDNATLHVTTTCCSGTGHRCLSTGRLEQFNGIAVRIFHLNLFAAGSDLHLIAKAHAWFSSALMRGATPSLQGPPGSSPGLLWPPSGIGREPDAPGPLRISLRGPIETCPNAGRFCWSKLRPSVWCREGDRALNVFDLVSSAPEL